MHARQIGLLQDCLPKNGQKNTSAIARGTMIGCCPENHPPVIAVAIQEMPLCSLRLNGCNFSSYFPKNNCEILCS